MSGFNGAALERTSAMTGTQLQELAGRFHMLSLLEMVSIKTLSSSPYEVQLLALRFFDNVMTYLYSRTPENPCAFCINTDVIQ